MGNVLDVHGGHSRRENSTCASSLTSASVLEIESIAEMLPHIAATSGGLGHCVLCRRFDGFFQGADAFDSAKISG